MASSRGIGFACALALAQNGMRVTITGRDTQQLDAARTAIQTRVLGAVVDAIAVDLTDSEERDRLLQQCPEPDVLVVNMGGPVARPGGTYSPSEWRCEFDELFIPMVDVMERTLPAMASKGWGRVVVISSTSIKQPIPNLVASGVLRSGVANLLAAHSQAYASKGVTLNSILPGRILTDRQKNALKRDAAKAGVSLDAHVAQVSASIPAGRLGEPQEIGAACAFFCSESAGFITGQNLVIDGGASRTVF